MSQARRRVHRAALLLAVAVGCACAAPTDPLTEVQEMHKAGRSADAMRTLDGLIAQRPTDPQLRFQKGVMLADQKRTAEAINVFQRLGQDFPALPEPFNNLAVLYVEQGQLDKARTALEAAIRSRPNYGTAFQNLGDVYTRMASRAYAKALQIEDPESAPKLALLRELYEAPALTPTVATAVVSAPASRPAAVAVAAASTPAVVSVPAASAAAASSVTASEPRSADDTRAINAAVRDWASAWSRKDLNAYFAAYATDFKGSDASAAAWQSNRRDRILGKRQISVEVSGLNVSIAKGVAKVTFRQSYAADLLRVSSQKVLELEQHNGKWLIRKESTGS